MIFLSQYYRRKSIYQLLGRLGNIREICNFLYIQFLITYRYITNSWKCCRTHKQYQLLGRSLNSFVKLITPINKEGCFQTFQTSHRGIVILLQYNEYIEIKIVTTNYLSLIQKNNNFSVHKTPCIYRKWLLFIQKNILINN